MTARVGETVIPIDITPGSLRLDGPIGVTTAELAAGLDRVAAASGEYAVFMRGTLESVAESAERSLKIVNPSGPSGNWSAATAPYMVEPMNLARSRLFESVVFMGPARSGKTVALVDGVLAYSIVDDHADCMVVQTSKDASADFSKMRMRRAIRRSPELMARLSP